jgi:hypothetical protein
MEYRLGDVQAEEHVALACKQMLAAKIPNLKPIYIEWLRDRSLLDAAIASANLEGIPVIDRGKIYPTSYELGRNPSTDALIGTYGAVEYVERSANTLPSVDSNIIRRIHNLIMGGDPSIITLSNYRPTNSTQTIGPDAETVTYTAPPGIDIPNHMNGFDHWLVNGCDGHTPPVAAALSLLEFVAIHPFLDGNGRTSRALARLLLKRGGSCEQRGQVRMIIKFLHWNTAAEALYRLIGFRDTSVREGDEKVFEITDPCAYKIPTTDTGSCG